MKVMHISYVTPKVGWSVGSSLTALLPQQGYIVPCRN